MKMKKLAICALSLATAAAMCAPVAAFAADAGTTEVKAAGTSDSTITGTISATTLSVSVPTTAAFTIDPTVEATATNTQITNVPTNYTVKNASAVPVYAYISKCAIAKSGSMTGTPTLVTAATGLTAANSLMFAVKDDASKPTNFDTAADWLTAATDLKYYPFGSADHGKLAAQKMKNGSPDAGQTDNAATMSFYGQTTTGWADGDEFVITPTFTVTTSDPEAASI